MKVLERSRALWNRERLDLDSDEILAQILERGELEAWRELYRRAAADPRLRARIKRIATEVPLPLPGFWLAAMAALGECVDFERPLPDYATSGTP